MILFDLASLPPLDGEGQVSELIVTMSNPSFEKMHLKWPSLETRGRSTCVSNGRTVDFLMLRMRPVASFLILLVCSAEFQATQAKLAGERKMSVGPL